MNYDVGGADVHGCQLREHDYPVHMCMVICSHCVRCARLMRSHTGVTNYIPFVRAWYSDLTRPCEGRLRQTRVKAWSALNISLQDLVDRLTLDEIVSQMSHGGALLNGNLLGWA